MFHRASRRLISSQSLLVASACALAVAAGCSSSSSSKSQTDGGAVEAGCSGIVDDAGNCVPKCDNSRCNPGNICVNNACTLTCTGHDQCPQGYECDPVVPDGSDAGGAGDAGGTATVCVVSKFPSGAGQFLAPCYNKGTADCDTADSFDCVGEIGDIDSYCSRYDCKADTDCPGGMYCATVRDAHQSCEITTIGTKTPCVHEADFTKGGLTYRFGPVSLLRNICLKRAYCIECDTDMDCTLGADQICVKPSGATKGYCTRACSADDASCPWSTGSVCTKDATRGNVCAPQWGACVGDKSLCSPCRSDEDCGSTPTTGPVAPRKYCWVSDYTLEPSCVDLDTACTTDTDCAPIKNGEYMHCVTDAVYQGSDIYNRCFPWYTGGLSPDGEPSGQISCWPSN